MRANPLGQFSQLKLIQSLFFVPQADLSITRTLLEKLPNRWDDYPEMLCWSIIAEKPTFVEFFLGEGINLDYPPESLTVGGVGIPKPIEDALKGYRKTPYVILAAGIGDRSILEKLLEAGRTLQERGHIGFSRLKSISVIGNVLAAAVFNDRTLLVQWLLETFSEADLDLEASVTEDRPKASRGGVNKEFSGCTPLLLAVHRSSLETIRKLLESGAKISATDWSKNTVLHLAVLMQRVEVVKELIDLPGIDVQARNSRGETPLSIAKEKGLTDIEALLSERIQDTSEQIAEELINELLEEESKKTKKKPKRLYEPRDEAKVPSSKKKPRKRPEKAQLVTPEVLSFEVEAPQATPAAEPMVEDIDQIRAERDNLRRTINFLTGKADYSALTETELISLEAELQGALGEVRKARSKT